MTAEQKLHIQSKADHDRIRQRVGERRKADIPHVATQGDGRTTIILSPDVARRVAYQLMSKVGESSLPQIEQDDTQKITNQLCTHLDRLFGKGWAEEEREREHAKRAKRSTGKQAYTIGD